MEQSSQSDILPVPTNTPVESQFTVTQEPPHKQLVAKMYEFINESNTLQTEKIEGVHIANTPQPSPRASYDYHHSITTPLFSDGSIQSFLSTPGHWKSKASHRYMADKLLQESGMIEFTKQQEMDLKAKLPLPLVTVMQRECLQILEFSLEDYRRHLGFKHKLTKQMAQRIGELTLSTEAKLVPNEIYFNKYTTIMRGIRKLFGFQR